MDEKEKQNSSLLEDDLLDDLLLEEEQKDTPVTPVLDEEKEEDDVLDMLDLEFHSQNAEQASFEKKEFDLDDLNLEAPIGAATPQSDNIDDLLDSLENTSVLNTYHPWRISLYEKLPFLCEADGVEKVFLIGYQNGQTARDKETHFQQHETDPIPYVISLDPDPHFISYSFFYGFFRKTLEKICLKNMAKEELRVVVKKKITGEFFKKYTFEFRNNPNLLHNMHEYVDTMTENIMESIEKMEGESNDGCR